jgi:hypothetical protein
LSAGPRCRHDLRTHCSVAVAVVNALPRVAEVTVSIAIEVVLDVVPVTNIDVVADIDITRIYDGITAMVTTVITTTVVATTTTPRIVTTAVAAAPANADAEETI